MKVRTHVAPRDGAAQCAECSWHAGATGPNVKSLRRLAELHCRLSGHVVELETLSRVTIQLAKPITRKDPR